MLKSKKNKNKTSRYRYIKIIEMEDYFRKNNYGYYHLYSLCFAATKVCKFFDKHFLERKGAPSDFSDIMNDLRDSKKSLEILYKRYYLSTEKDYRTGYASYGYKSIADIRSTLSYICDRWKCAYRIKWLIDLCDIDLKGLE